MCVCVIICLRFPPLLQNFLFCTYIILYILFMMTSVVTDAARGNRDRALQQTTHTSQPQKQIQVSATHTPSVRCDIWTGQSIYIWLCFDYGCRLSLGHSGTDPTRPGDLRQKWCRFWGQSPAGEQHQNNFCFLLTVLVYSSNNVLKYTDISYTVGICSLKNLGCPLLKIFQVD